MRAFYSYLLSQRKAGGTDPFQLAFYQGDGLRKLVDEFCALASYEGVSRAALAVAEPSPSIFDFDQDTEGRLLINTFCAMVSRDRESSKNAQMAAEKLKKALEVSPREVHRELGITGWYGLQCESWIAAFVAETWSNPWADSLFREMGRRLWLILQDIDRGMGPSEAAVHLGISSHKRGPKRSSRIEIDIRSTMLVNHFRAKEDLSLEDAIVRVSELEEGIGSEETILKSYKRQNRQNRHCKPFTGDAIAALCGVYQPTPLDIGVHGVEDFDGDRQMRVHDDSVNLLIAGIKKRRLKRKN